MLVPLRRFLLCLCPFLWLVGLSGGYPPSTAEAAPPVEWMSEESALRAVEIARIEQRQYERVEYPSRLRQLDSKIKLTQLEIASLARRLEEYERTDRMVYSRPLVLTLEQNRLAMAAAELHLADLKEEKFLLERYHADRRRLYQLKLDQARAQLAAIQQARP